MRNGKDKDDFIKTISGSRYVLDPLEKIVIDLIEEVERSADSEDYSSPSWPYLQADRIGKLKAYKTVLSLLNYKGRKDLNE